jgi:hypothetical protein
MGLWLCLIVVRLRLQFTNSGALTWMVEAFEQWTGSSDVPAHLRCFRKTFHTRHERGPSASSTCSAGPTCRGADTLRRWKSPNSWSTISVGSSVRCDPCEPALTRPSDTPPRARESGCSSNYSASQSGVGIGHIPPSRSVMVVTDEADRFRHVVLRRSVNGMTRKPREQGRRKL